MPRHRRVRRRGGPSSRPPKAAATPDAPEPSRPEDVLPEPPRPRLPESPRLRAAFSETCDPAAYVPRAATETALAHVDAWEDMLGAGPGLAALVGSPGIGKTFLLRRIERERAGAAEDVGFTSIAALARGAPQSASWAIYLPYAGLAPRDLCLWVYGLVNRRIEADRVGDARGAFDGLAALGSGARGPLLLLIDDADSMPPESVAMLVEGLDAARVPLRVLLALDDEPRGEALLASLGPASPTLVELGARMTPDETADYVRGRMRWAGFPEVEVRGLSARTLERIHAGSAGVPRRVHRVAAALLAETQVRAGADPGPEAWGGARGGGDAAPDAHDPARPESWMGKPIDDDFGF